MSIAWTADHMCPGQGCGPFAHVSADCHEGKHPTCHGDAWCDSMDRPDGRGCACACHEPGGSR